MKQAEDNFSLFNLGFRVFFLGAGVFSVLTASLWMLVYLFQMPLSVQHISGSQWHAHEMIYGYSMAVIAGFLLTAVKNWTGIQTVKGRPLMLLFILWVLARVLFLFGTQFLIVAAIFDLMFSVILSACVCYPIFKTRNWRQLAVILKLACLAIFNIFFYLGALGLIDSGLHWGIYGGLYLIIGLILTMGRRVVPMFIERGVGYEVKLFNSKWLDISSLVLFLSFFVTELFLKYPLYSAILSLALFIVHGIRLIGWHTPGIWKKSLLWSLYLSFWFICTGFLFYAAAYFWGIYRFLGLHAFAFGGIGLVTMAMMSRVTIGHTARNIHKPPKSVGIAFAVLCLGAVFRVIMPVIDIQNYLLWIGISQILWIVSFMIFLFTFYPVFISPRLDGKPG